MVWYDGLRVFRGLFRHKEWVINAEDAVFWLFCALSVFSFLYGEDDGVVRWYALFAMGAGMVFWNRTASPFLVGGLIFIFRKTGAVFRKPFRFFLRFLKKRLQKPEK